MRFRFCALLCVFALSTTPCAAAADSPVVSSQKADFRVTAIAGALDHPWSLAFLPGGDYLVTERRGKFWRITPQGQKTEIPGGPVVYNYGQGGLLDVVPAPGFQDGGWIYFSYSGMDAERRANTEVARAKLDLKSNSLMDLEVIFRAEPKVEGGNHWGSRLLFAPDGTLYVTLGERFNYSEEAQNPANHLGAIVRIMPDGSVPPDNPFAGENGKKPEIFSYGHRNVQGIALHPQTGDIWTHEHGPKGGDEINILKPGANYGWPAVTFGISYWGLPISDKTSATGMEDPVLQWTPSIAPSGMAFYTGDKFPQWKGNLFVGALAHRHLRRLELGGDTVVAQEELLKDRRTRIRDVRQGPDGYLYLLTDSRDGQLLRLEPVLNHP